MIHGYICVNTHHLRIAPFFDESLEQGAVQKLVFHMPAPNRRLGDGFDRVSDVMVPPTPGPK